MVSVLSLLSLHTVYTCNEAVCASIVSKCMLTASCKCDVEDCTCCKDCFYCLDYLYDECCSCVELCPKPNISGSPLSRQSHVEDLPEPTPALFKALTNEEDLLDRWHSFTFPIDLPVSTLTPNQHKEVKYQILAAEQDAEQDTVTPVRKDIVTVNCTVAYMSNCMPWNKCKGSCRSMGSTSYRWFHDGCCQCVGHTCINYGINESRCKQCPESEEGEEVDEEIIVIPDDDYNLDEENQSYDYIDQSRKKGKKEKSKKYSKDKDKNKGTEGGKEEQKTEEKGK